MVYVCYTVPTPSRAADNGQRFDGLDFVIIHSAACAVITPVSTCVRTRASERSELHIGRARG